MSLAKVEPLILDDGETDFQSGNPSSILVPKEELTTTIKKNNKPSIVGISPETIQKVTNTTIIISQDEILFKTYDPTDAAHFSTMTKTLTSRGWEDWSQRCVEGEYILRVRFNSSKQIKI